MWIVLLKLVDLLILQLLLTIPHLLVELAFINLVVPDKQNDNILYDLLLYEAIISILELHQLLHRDDPIISWSPFELLMCLSAFFPFFLDYFYYSA